MMCYDKMLSQEKMSPERVATILKRYQRRLENNKKWAKHYYSRHADDIKRQKLLAGVARGRCPSAKTVERLEVDQSLLIDAWLSYTSVQEELTDKARSFHRYLIGEDWALSKDECV